MDRQTKGQMEWMKTLWHTSYAGDINMDMSKSIGLGKSGYQVKSFLISPGKHMLWVLIKSALLRHF